MKKNPSKTKIYVIIGPTASGKTDAAIRLAQKIGGEVISADSRAVYKGLTIGANIPSKKEMAGIPHHLFEIYSPKKVFTVSDFVRLADQKITEIAARGHLPIIVGGTGLYVDGLLRRIPVPDVPPNEKLRRKLEKKSTSTLFEMLKKLDPKRAKNIERQNPRRLIRAIEIAKAIGKSPDGLKPTTPSPYDAVLIGINPPQNILYKKIADRAGIQVRRGLIQETKKIKEKYRLSWKRINELGFEYRLASEVLCGTLNKKDLVKKLAMANSAYAKRQIRYMKRNPDIQWIPHLTNRILGGI